MDNRPPPRRPSGQPAPTRRQRQDAANDAAREVAIAALAFIAAAPTELSRFLALTGIEAGGIRAAAAEPGFLEGVLAYIAGNERTLLAFAHSAGIAPQDVENARFTLAGAGAPEPDPPPPQT